MGNSVGSPKSTGMKKRTKKLIFCLALITLPLIQFVIFYIGVNLNSIKLAFWEFNGTLDETGHFIGFKNFATVIDEIVNLGNWPILIRNSFAVWGLGLVLKLPLSIIISYFVYKSAKVGGLFKVILFAPSIISVMILVMLYEFFVDTALPVILQRFFSVNLEMSLFKDPGLRFWTIYAYGFLTGFGVGLLLYTNAMSSISASIVESAHLDGVNYIQEFWYITLPMIFPTLKTLFVVGFTGILTDQFGLFEFYGMTAPTDIQTVGYYIFKETILVGPDKYPRLSAMGIIATCVAVPMTLLARYLLNKVDPMEV